MTSREKHQVYEPNRASLLLLRLFCASLYIHLGKTADYFRMIGLDFCSNIKKIFISQRHCYSLNPLVLSENIFISSNASTLANLFQKEQVVPYNDTRSGILNQSSSPGRFFSMISNDDDCHKINSA